MRFFLQFILLIILFKYLWRMIKKYWPSISDVNEPVKSTKVNKSQFKIDNSQIEDAEFTELDDK